MFVTEAIKYLHKTSFKQMSEDMAQYRGLKQLCRELNVERIKANVKLTQVIDERAVANAVPGCIKRKVFVNALVCEPRNGDIEIEHRCEYFSAPSYCTRVGCPFVGEHNTLADAMKRYASAKKMQKNFWNEKFENAK